MPHMHESPTYPLGDVFCDAFNASPIGIALEDLDGRPRFANPAFCSMFGLTQEEVLGKHCVEFSPAEDAEKDWALFQQLRAGLIDRYHLDKRYFRRDGSMFWGRVSVSLLNHRPSPFVIAIVEDITDRIRSRETLELATKEMMVVRCSRDFRYLWVSPGYARGLLRSPDEIIGRTIVEILGKDAFEALRPKFERVLAGETVSLEEEFRVHGLGRRWVSATYTPARDAAGEVVGWVGVVVDVTDRKAAEQERLHHSVIIESTDDAVYSHDLGGAILSWNPGAERLFGYTAAEAIGQPVTFMIPDELLEEAADIHRRVLNGDHIKRYGTRRLRKDGTTVDVAVTISPVRDRDGLVVGGCRIARDITDRRRFEQSLLWRLEFERLLSDLSRTFISLPDDEVDSNVERAMARIGAFLDIDRIGLFEMSDTRTEIALKHLWNAPGVMKPSPVVTTQDQPWWTKQVLQGEISLASTLDDLPAEAASEKEYLRQRGVVSAASIPLNVGGEITGAISFITVNRQLTWTDDLIGQLRVVGDIFSNALKRKHAMENLRAAEAITRESEERFRLMANTAPAMIWVTGTDTLCTYVNQSWLAFSGLSLESALGKGWAVGMHRDDAARSWRAYTEAFDRREPFEVEFRYRRHDGQYRWLLDHGVPRFGLDGSFAGYIGSCIDVTDRKEADLIRSSFSRRLIQAQEEERAAVGRELHDDINQRVALAALNLETLKTDAAVPADTRGELAKVIQQLAELSEDIQALSHRLHSSKLEHLGLRAAAAGFCREVSAKHKVDIDFEAGDIPRDLGHDISICLFRVLQEAVQNSTKHSGSPRLHVSLQAAPTELQLVVSDGGKGFRLQDAMRGHGIGLVNMTERLRLVRGHLSIDTEPGRGTVLRARVPLGARAPSPRAGA
jgi:PAS domain S-box-containing protein